MYINAVCVWHTVWVGGLGVVCLFKSSSSQNMVWLGAERELRGRSNWNGS